MKPDNDHHGKTTHDCKAMNPRGRCTTATFLNECISNCIRNLILIPKGKLLSMNSQRYGCLNKKQIMTTSVDISMWMGKLYGPHS
ncbi:hypothetical protein LEMLEM_LOCUS8128 [Lemmus lemmus]